MQILRNFFTPIVSKHKKQNFKEQKLLSLKKVSFFLLFNENFILFLTSMLLACYKPSGISSFDVVKIIRTHFQDKVWHSGTLDPMASGLMILGIGKGTKELTSLIGLDKSYETTVDFSLLTDTRDASFWEKEERFEVITSDTPLMKGGEGGSLQEAKRIPSYYLPFNPSLTEKTRTLRSNPTPAEKKLRYSFLTSHPSKFLRKKPIDNYIVDFYAHQEQLIIEVDGDTHRSDEEIRYDQERTKKLESYGLSMIRFTNTEIFEQFEAVCARIDQILEQKKEHKKKVFSKSPLIPPSKGGRWTPFLHQWEIYLKKEGKLVPAPSLDQISQLLDSILFQEEKEVLLPLPTFSAKKQNGKRLYKDARKGTAEIQEKPMKIYAYKILDYQFPLLKLRLKVGSGTYIRSIGYWLGQQLGLGGALIQLERTSTGKFQLSDIGTQNSAKGNIKGQERTIYFKEIARDTI